MQWSDAARTPRDVAAAVDESGEVRLERRGSIALVITREDRVEQTRDGLGALARLLSVLANEDATMLRRVLALALPWTQFLPEKDQVEFGREVTWTVQACSDLGIWAPFGRLLHEWQQTAAIHADPALAKELSRALDADLGPVLPPTEEEDAADVAEQG